MIQMNKKSVCRLLRIGAGKWADGLNQGVAPPDSRSRLTTVTPDDLINASSARKRGKWLTGMALTAALLGVGGNIFAQSNIAKYPGTVVGLTQDDAFLSDWSSTSSIDEGHSAIVAGTYASSTLGFLATTSESLNLTNFDFSALSNDATIVGIEVKLWKSRQVTGSDDGTITDNRIQLLSAGSTANKASGTAWTAVSDGVVSSTTYGSATDLWATTSNNATLIGQIKNSAFGFQVRASKSGGSFIASRQARIHGASVTVYYTLPNSDVILSMSSVSIPTTTYGTSSQAPVSVSGSYLTADVTATLSSGYADRFEISKDGTTWGAGPLAYTHSSGTLAASTFQIRTKANANVGNGTLSNVVTFTSGTADAENLGVTYDIDAKELTLTGLSVNNKVYDGTNAATATTPTLSGVVSPDVVTFSGTPTFTFASLNAATGINVNRSGDYVLGGTAASNYTLTQPGTLTANITPAPVTVTANNMSKCFDAELEGGEVAPSAGRYTVSSLVGADAVDNVELTSVGFAGGSAAGTHPIVPSDLELSVGSLSNYSVTYNNGTLTVTDEIKAAVVGAANLNICNGSAASVNFDLLGGGVPTVSNPFAGEFWIKLDGTTDSVVHPFSITGLPYAVTIPAAKLPAVTSTSKYKIYWKSLSNGTGCATSDPSSLTGFVEITVDRTPTIAVDKSSLITQCSNIAPTFTVTNPNAVTGATYDVAVNYKTITGGSYATGITAHAFGTLSEGALVNNGITADTVTYTFTARKGGSGAPLCSSAPVVVKYVIQPKVRYQDVTATNDSVCQNDLAATSFSINGLLPNTVHELTFDITGDDESLGQIATRTSDASGAIVFNAAAFNGGSPAPGTYTFTLTNVRANGCDSAITTGNAQTLTIKPTPTFTNVTLTGNEVCQENLTADTFRINGLLAGKAHKITFDITGDDVNEGQTTTLTANADGVIAFTAANFNDGNPAPGTYNFILRGLEVDGCSINVTANNTQTITIKPTPTFAGIAVADEAETVCANELETVAINISGLLNGTQTVGFTITDLTTGAETPLQTADDIAEDGVISFTALEFNEGSPAPGKYKITIKQLVKDGCTLNITTDNTAELEILPVPTFEGLIANEGTEICQDETDEYTFTINGLMADKPQTIWYAVSLNEGEEFTNDVNITPTGTSFTFSAGDFGMLDAGVYNFRITKVVVDGCEKLVENEGLEVVIKATPTISTFTVDESSSTTVCVDNREQANFMIEGLLNGENTINYTITKAGTPGSITKDYTAESGDGMISFDGSEFTGSGVLPGVYTITINTITVDGCVKTFTEDKPTVNVTFTGTPAISFTEATKTIYVGAGCATTMPNYMPTLNGLSSGTPNENSNITVTAGEGCVADNITIEQMAPNAPSSPVIGFGGDRSVIFKITKTIANGGTIIMYDSFKLHIADTTRPTAIAYATDTVYLNNAGTASLTAAAVNNGSSDNCTSPSSLDLKVSRGGAQAVNAVFTCADKDAPVPVTLYVKDASGNTSTAITNVTVLDTVRPVITGTMANLTVDKGALCTNEMPDYTTALDGISYTDNCGTGSFTITQSPVAGTIIAKSVESQVVTITVKDASNNAATTSFTITYEDNTAPVFAGVPTSDVTVDAESGECAASVELPNITATDNCTEEVMVVTERGDGMEEGSEFGIGTTVITYIATDAKGNADTGTYNVVVTPTITAPWIVLESEDFYVPEVGLLDMSNVIMLTTSSESPCAAMVENWPTATLSNTPCAELGLVATEAWTIEEGMPVTSDYEFPVGETTVTYTASYTYNGETVSSNAHFTVIVSDNTVPVLATIEDKAFEVDAAGCVASIPATGMNVEIDGLCDEEEASISWSITKEEAPEEGEEPIVTTVYSGTGQISASELAIELPVGEYTVNYNVEDVSGNDATTSFTIIVTNPLDAMIEGTATVVKNALTTSTVKFTGEGGLAPYTFTYNVYVNDETTPSTAGVEIATLPGSDAVTIAQSNGAVGTFRYEVVSVRDAKGCEVEADETHIFARNATITVIEPTAADISMNVRIAPASLKSTGVPREVSFRLTNIGGSATTSGVVSFVVTKPRANVAGVPTCTLTATTSGWEVIPHSNPNYWIVRSTSAISINGGNTLQEVKCNLTYTGPAKGSATVTATLPNGVGGDSNNSNNSFSRTIIIN